MTLGWKLGRNLKHKHFVGLGKAFQVESRVIEKMPARLCDGIVPFIKRLDEIGLGVKKTADLKRVILKRRDDLGTS